MNMIVAVDKNWAIGRDGRLLVAIPEDQKLFREETLGKVVIMGRKTLESLPGGKPLYGRTTLVLSRDSGYQVKGASVFHSVPDLLAYVKNIDTNDIFVAGGQEIYREFLPYCQTAHVTFIDYAYEADSHCPNLDLDPEWVMDLETEEATYFDLCYTFRRYVRRKRS